MGLVGCYDLHLYCDDPDHGHHHPSGWAYPHELTGRTEAACIRQARALGWVVNKKREGREGNGHCLCPFHKRRGKAAAAPSPSKARAAE